MAKPYIQKYNQVKLTWDSTDSSRHKIRRCICPNPYLESLTMSMTYSPIVACVSYADLTHRPPNITLATQPIGDIFVVH